MTVGRLAERVGVKYYNSYRHYPTLDALTADPVDLTFAELALPEPKTGCATVALPELPAAVLPAHCNMTDAVSLAGSPPTRRPWPPAPSCTPQPCTS